MLPGPQRTSKNKTVMLGEQRAPFLPAERDKHHTGLLEPPWRLLMQIGDENQATVGLEVRDQIVIGRADPLAGFYPDLDLTAYGGKEHGVSRRHVTISQNEPFLYVQDIDSVNGTRINGFQLESRKRYRLRDGDELQLGRIRIVVRFVRSPF